MSAAADVVAGLCSGFQSAVRLHPSELVVRDFTLAGRRARFRVAGRELADGYLWAIRHLEDCDDAAALPDLTVELYDARFAEKANSPSLAPSYELAWPAREGYLYVAGDRRFYGLEVPDVSLWLDLRLGSVVGRIESAGVLPHEERGKPLGALLPYWIAGQDILWAHAGLVSRDGFGLLISGPGGSGKSTTSLACLSGGFDYLADDYCGLSIPSDGPVTGHSVYCSAQLYPDHLDRFPTLRNAAAPGFSFQGKKQLRSIDLSGVRTERSTRVAAIALPVVSGERETRFRRARKSEAYVRMLTSSVFLFPSQGYRRTVDAISLLVERVPVFWLDLGHDIDGIAPVVAELLDSALTK